MMNKRKSKKKGKKGKKPIKNAGIKGIKQLSDSSNINVESVFDKITMKYLKIDENNQESSLDHLNSFIDDCQQRIHDDQFLAYKDFFQSQSNWKLKHPEEKVVKDKVKKVLNSARQVVSLAHFYASQSQNSQILHFFGFNILRKISAFIDILMAWGLGSRVELLSMPFAFLVGFDIMIFAFFALLTNTKVRSRRRSRMVAKPILKQGRRTGRGYTSKTVRFSDQTGASTQGDVRDAGIVGTLDTQENEEIDPATVNFKKKGVPGGGMSQTGENFQNSKNEVNPSSNLLKRVQLSSKRHIFINKTIKTQKIRKKIFLFFSKISSKFMTLLDV